MPEHVETPSPGQPAGMQLLGDTGCSSQSMLKKRMRVHKGKHVSCRTQCATKRTVVVDRTWLVVHTLTQHYSASSSSKRLIFMAHEV